MVVSVLLVDNFEVPKGSNEEEAKMKLEKKVRSDSGRESSFPEPGEVK